MENEMRSVLTLHTENIASKAFRVDSQELLNSDSHMRDFQQRNNSETKDF